MGATVGQMNIVLSANAATFSAAIDQAQRKLNSLAGTSQKMGHVTVTSVQAASGALRELNGDFTHNIRAVERFITTIPGVGDALKAAFPVVGGLALAAMFVELGTKVAAFRKEINELPNKIRDGFRELHSSAQLANDTLRLTNDRLQNEIDKLQGKPQNNLAIAIDETRIAADKLSKSLMEDQRRVKELLEQNKVGIGSQLGSGLMGHRVGTTSEVSGSVKAYRDQLADLGDQMNVATHRGDTSGAASLTQQIKEKERSYAEWLDKQITTRSGNVASIDPKLKARSYASYHGDQSANLSILRGERSSMYDRADQEKEEGRNPGLEAKKADLEAKKAVAETSKRADEQRLKAMEAALNQEKLIHNVSLKEVYDFWDARRSAFRAGSDAYNQVVAKQAQIAVESAAKAHEAIKKYTDTQVRSEDNFRLPEQLARGQATFRRGAVKDQGEESQGYLDSNKSEIDSAHNESREREATVTDAAGRSMTRYAAALELAQIHAREFSREMEALKANLDVRAMQQGLDPSKENAKALAEAQAAIADAQSKRTIQVQSDKDSAYGRDTSGVVGAKDALDQFVQSTRDAAAEMGHLAGTTLSDLNRTLVTVLTTTRREGGPHFYADQFKDLGRGVATNVAGAGVSKLEGMLLSSVGLGGRRKPTGSAGDAMHVLIDNMSGGASMSSVMPGGANATSVTGLAGMVLNTLPMFAAGGAISAGTMSIIGEKGPELFMPGTSGTVIPNSAMRSSASAGAVHVSVDARGAGDPAQVEAAAHRAVMRAAPHIVAASMQAGKQQKMRTPQTVR